MIQYRLYALAPETAGKPVGFGIRAKERQEKAEIYHVEKKRKKISAEKEKVGIAAAAVIVGGRRFYADYHNLPQTKVEKQLTLAAKYMDGI